jgi:hypothetical protein
MAMHCNTNGRLKTTSFSYYQDSNQPDNATIAGIGRNIRTLPFTNFISRAFGVALSFVALFCRSVSAINTTATFTKETSPPISNQLNTTVHNDNLNPKISDLSSIIIGGALGLTAIIMIICAVVIRCRRQVAQPQQPGRNNLQLERNNLERVASENGLATGSLTKIIVNFCSQKYENLEIVEVSAEELKGKTCLICLDSGSSTSLNSDKSIGSEEPLVIYKKQIYHLSGLQKAVYTNAIDPHTREIPDISELKALKITPDAMGESDSLILNMHETMV